LSYLTPNPHLHLDQNRHKTTNKQESDFEFAFRLEDDFANAYEAQRVLIEENDWMFRNRVRKRENENKHQSPLCP
jgi:hypothetical protein